MEEVKKDYAETLERIKKEYPEILKLGGLDASQKLTNDDQKIILWGKRFILMGVDAFPAYMIKSTANIMGERIAREFLYWFGFSYGETVAQRYLNIGIPKELVPKYTAAASTLFGGWGISEILEFDLEKGKLVIKVYNDFETESAQLNGAEPTNNFVRGMWAGALSKVINEKTHATAEFKEGVTIITVEKR